MENSTIVPDLTDTIVFDCTGEKVGEIRRVFIDEETHNPVWLTVTTGLFGRTETFVPLFGARFVNDELRLAHEKSVLVDAPRTDEVRDVDVTQVHELAEFFGLTHLVVDVPSDRRDVIVNREELVQDWASTVTVVRHDSEMPRVERAFGVIRLVPHIAVTEPIRLIVEKVVSDRSSDVVIDITSFDSPVDAIERR